jgi:hypothetical protein
MPNIQTLEYTNSTTHQNDKGPANEQTDFDDIDGVTHSSVLLPDETFNLRDKVQNIVNEIVGDNHEEVTVNSRDTITIPWPSISGGNLGKICAGWFISCGNVTQCPLEATPPCFSI